MANRFYPKGAEKVLRAQVNFEVDAIKVALVTSGYTFSTAHEFLSQVTTYGTPQVAEDATVTGGVFDAADLDFGNLATGQSIKALVMFKDTGNPATSPVLMYLDEITGFPFITSGSGLRMPWSDSDAKVFSLVN